MLIGIPFPPVVPGYAKARVCHDKKEVLSSYKAFLELFGDKDPKACQCGAKDKQGLFIFCDFPAAHWRRIRSTNPIEYTFATVLSSHVAGQGLWFSCGTPYNGQGIFVSDADLVFNDGRALHNVLR